jgi:HSP20 family protein
MLTIRRELFPEPWNDVQQFRSEVNRLLTAYGGARPLAASFPVMNVWQDDSNLYVEAELPGMQLSDLEIYVLGGNQLTVKGERKLPEIESAVWHRRERGFGSFMRVLSLPVPVDADKVQAKLVAGVLTITLPESEIAKPRKIAIQAE